MRLAISLLFILILRETHGEEEERFVCIKTGRYENPTDDTCNSFYLCSYSLKGELIQTQYSCPEKTIFSPVTGTCSKNYTCPRVSRTARDLVQIETTNNVHYYCEDQRINNYECRRSGRYADLVGSTCRKYYLCSLLESGTYIKTLFECPEGSFFDPITQRCHLNYECPCQPKLPPYDWNSNWDSSRQEERNENIGWLERYKWTELFERWTEHYRWTEISRKETTQRPAETSSIRVTTEACIDSADAKPFICKEEGKFPDRKDVTCTDYFFCSKLLTGGFVKTKLSCTYGSTFDPYLKKCSMKYECPCQIETISTYRTTARRPYTVETTPSPTEIVDYTTLPQPTPLDCQIPETEFVCTRKGRYPDKRDSSCNTYFLCRIDVSGKFEKQRYRCPRCLTFDPAKERCTDNYVCPCSFTEAPPATTRSSNRTKTTPTDNTSSEKSSTLSSKSSNQPSEKTSSTNTRSTTDSCIIPPPNKHFECQKEGIFSNLKDMTCSSYYICTKRRNGSFEKTKYRCPKSTQYDPSLKRCYRGYKCPCSRNSETTTSESITLSTSTSAATSESDFTSSTSKTQKPRSTTEKSVTTTSKGITNDCVISPHDEPFRCRANGRFVDKRDYSCSSYFLCSAQGKGDFIQTKYRCPKNSYFDPATQRCSSSYDCPCSIYTGSTAKYSTSTSNSTGEASVTPSEKPSNPTQNTDITDKGTKSSSSSSSTPKSTAKTRSSPSSASTEKISSTSSSVAGSTSKTSSTEGGDNTSSTSKTQKTRSTSENPGSSTTSKETGTTNDCIIPPHNRPFRCLIKGRFPDKRDLSCSSYYLCSALNNGTLIKTKYRCPRNSYFDPSIHRCSRSYECPCSNTPGTTPKYSTTKSSSTGKSSATPSEEPSNPTEGTDITDEGTKSTSSTSKSTAKTRSPPSSASTENISSTSSSVTVTLTSSTPKSTGKTRSTFSSSTSTTSEGTNTTSDCIIPPHNRPFRCHSEGRFPDKKDMSCATYFICSRHNNGSFIKTKHRCPGNSYFDPSIQQCSKYYACPCWISSGTPSGLPSTLTPSTTENSPSPTFTTSSTCADPPSSYKFICETTGRFADIRDKSCMSYFLCSLLDDGTYVQAKYRCVSGLKFNPLKNNCSPFYTCPCEISSSVQTTEGSTSLSTALPDMCQPSDKEFVCKSVGRFPKPGDVSCCTYYSCTKSTNGTIAQTEFSCPEGTSFDPVFRTCSDSYQCPCHVTESPQYFNTSSDECIVPTEIFACTAPGRFPNRQDVSCCNYFLCSDAENGTFTKTEFNCPMGKSFDPELGRCSSSYVCPCRITENPVTSTVETSETTISTRAPTTAITQPAECDVSINNPEHVCTQRGRFRDNKDLTCSNYFLCSRLRSGQFIRTRYSCPRFSYFDPSLGLCTTTYKCPCINTFTTVSANTGKITKIPGTRAPWHNITKKTPRTTTPRRCVQANPTLTNFVCAREGKFLNPLDTKCTSYIHCVRKASVLVKTVVNCEGMTAFDVDLQKCTSNAICEICKE